MNITILNLPYLKFVEISLTYYIFLNRPFLKFSFRQIEVYSIEDNNHPNVETEENNVNDSNTLPQQRKPLHDLPNQPAIDNENLELQEEQWNSGGDLIRSQSIRSGLKLNLSNNVHRGHMVRTRSAVPTSSISPSIISSLISLEAFGANKEKRQHSTGTCSANVQAQVN